MTKLPRITIITPSYNQAEFISQTIRSVVTQNYPNLEYLIMDGGSTDGSVKIIKKFAARYPKIIKFESKKDKGQVDAINKGLKKATGDIIAYINSDDYYLPGALEAVGKYFKKYKDTLWLVGNCQITRPALKWTFFLKNIIPIHKLPFLLKLGNFINQPSVFLSRKIIDQVGLLNNKYDYAFDYDYWLRCLAITPPKKTLTDLAVFRIHKKSKGSTGYTAQFQEDFEVVKKHTSNHVILLLHYILNRITVIAYFGLK